jgi:hypothetical protein
MHASMRVITSTITAMVMGMVIITITTAISMGTAAVQGMAVSAQQSRRMRWSCCAQLRRTWQLRRQRKRTGQGMRRRGMSWVMG